MNTYLPTRLALGLCALLSAAAHAASNNSFIDEAVSAGMAEIQTSQLALEKTESAQVKAFAEQMIKDHTKTNQLPTLKHHLEMAKQLQNAHRKH
ncbi:hypothetical protein D3C81_1044140 [compost metagenome]